MKGARDMINCLTFLSTDITLFVLFSTFEEVNEGCSSRNVPIVWRTVVQTMVEILYGFLENQNFDMIV